MNKLNDLCDMIDSLDIPESQKFNLRMAAHSVESAGILHGYNDGFKAGIKEGRELEAMKHLPHNQPEFINRVTTPERWESIRPNVVLEDHINETIS